MESINNIVYRVQSTNLDTNPFFNRHIPIKRVSVSADGNIDFNPDEHKYIYFSKNEKHHCYYIYHKVVKIINDILRDAKSKPEYAKLDLPDNMAGLLPGRCNALQYYTNMNMKVMQNVQTFFSDYLPPQYVELVSLKYLHSFASLLDDCTVKNTRKCHSNGPEISDTGLYRGAYGINDTWLDLLKCSTTESRTAKLSLDRFFDFLIEESYYGRAGRARLAELGDNQGFFKILESMTFTKLANPLLTEKNNINDITHHIQRIESLHQYNPNIDLSSSYFRDTIADFKQEIRDYREDMGE